MVFKKDEQKKAIAYYRHSAEDKQENSVPIQREHAQEFAKQNNIEIIHEEADEGKTGLLADRPGFERLFSDWVLNEEAPNFEYVLVFDVSRWGRFQDQDEAAYYEFRCKQHGKKVVYISRGFPKEEEQLISHLQTSIERYMAAEYSRQLSDKVFYGAAKVSEQGYSAGGMPCYGMSRLLLDEQKKPIKKLKKGEWKSLANERVTFTPSEDETTETVKNVFEELATNWRTPNEIAEQLNEKKILSPAGKQWKRGGIIRVLTNEVYIGTRIYNKTWNRLRQKTRRNPRNEWVIKPNAFTPVVSKDTFKKAQEHLYWLMRSRWKRGVYLINNTRRLIVREVGSLLMDNGFIEDEIERLTKGAPVAFSVNFYRDGTAHWCFTIQEGIRNFDTVLAVGVAMDETEPKHRFFRIPTSDFSIVNFLVVSEQDPKYEQYTLTEEEARGQLNSLAGVLQTV